MIGSEGITIVSRLTKCAKSRAKPEKRSPMINLRIDGYPNGVGFIASLYINDQCLSVCLCVRDFLRAQQSDLSENWHDY